jgi:glyoxylase-like metal-dependent hydrolase (beta-lactamase superfamily II)
MKRTVVLGVIILGGVITSAIVAAQQGGAAAGQGREAGPGRGAGRGGPPVQPIEKVKDNLYLIQGQGGNTAVYIAQNGVVLVDTKNPNNGQAILDQVKTVTDKPITHIINTHTHGDHNGSNPFFPASVEIVVQENTKGYMEKMPAFQEAANKNGLPDRTFKDKMSVLRGKDTIDLYYFGPAHTGGDTFVAFPALRIMHAGDVFARKGLPIMDKNNGGSGVEFANTVRKAVKGVPNIDAVINGHTAANTTPADMLQFADFVADFVAHVQAGKKAGKPAEQVAKEWSIPAKYADFTATPIETVTAYVNVIFGETK